MGSIIDKNRPKTMQEKADKMMTGERRRNSDDLSYQEKVDYVFGPGSSSKKGNRKKKNNNYANLFL